MLYGSGSEQHLHANKSLSLITKFDGGLLRPHNNNDNASNWLETI